MAKRLKVTGVETTPDGINLTFERMGERFVCDVETVGVAAVVQLLLRALESHGASFQTTAETIRFAETPARAGAPPALVIDTAAGVIVLGLSWAQVSSLSALSGAMLERSPAGGRSN